MSRNPITLGSTLASADVLDFRGRPKYRPRSNDYHVASSRDSNGVLEERATARVDAHKQLHDANDILRSDRGKLLHGTPPPPSPPTAPYFSCPITMMPMKDPVQDREGNSYEKGAIQQWLLKHSTSPVTRNRLTMKHLVPNRALKEAIEFEATQQKETHARKFENATLPSNQTPSRSTYISTTPITSATSAKNSTKDHHQIINSFLSDLNITSQLITSRLDQFGIAFLPMNKLQPTIMNEKINMLMVINAPPTKDKFQLFTHFNVSIEQQRIVASLEEPAAGTSNENRVFNNLMQHGKHKSLTLTKLCEERMRFGFEGKNSEISNKSCFVGILNMFVKVSFRMKKRIEA